MGRNISFNRLASLRNEILDLGAVFCGSTLPDSSCHQPSFQSNRQMLDFLWNVRSLTYEACVRHGLSRGWWTHLQKIYGEWEFVRNALAIRYMPLVKSMAKKYSHPTQESSDLIQEGAKGMLRAMDSFLPEYGVPFEAYARPWIQKYLSLCISKNCTPTFVLDLDIPDKAENPEQRFTHQETITFLNQCVQTLDVNAQKVLRLHYGPEKRPSLEEIGAKCGFSREKTRKIEQKAIKNLAKRMKTRV